MPWVLVYWVAEVVRLWSSSFFEGIHVLGTGNVGVLKIPLHGWPVINFAQLIEHGGAEHIGLTVCMAVCELVCFVDCDAISAALRQTP